jgi:hypothetical protein
MKSFLLAGLALASQAAWAGTVALKSAFAVPLLDDAAITILAVAVGGVAGWALKRRRRN